MPDFVPEPVPRGILPSRRREYRAHGTAYVTSHDYERWIIEQGEDADLAAQEAAFQARQQRRELDPLDRDPRDDAFCDRDPYDYGSHR